MPNCGLCNQDFKVQESLTKHMKKVHFIVAPLKGETTVIYELVFGRDTISDDLENTLKSMRMLLENLSNKGSVYLEITRKEVTK